MQRTSKKRGPYKRRFHTPMFDIPEKTTTKLGRTIYQRLYMQRVREGEKKK